MKKGFVWLTVAVLAISLTACGGGNSAGAGKEGGSDATQETTAGDAGFSFKAPKGTEIQLNVPAADIISALGEPQDKYEAESCAFQGMDRCYTYAGFQLDTYENNGVETTLNITFKDDTVSTAEGISIGDDMDKVKSEYSTFSVEENTGSIVYTKGNTTLTFFFGSDNTVSQIQYSAIVK